MERVERQFPKTFAECKKVGKQKDMLTVDCDEVKEFGINEALILAYQRRFIYSHAAKRSIRHWHGEQWWNYCSCRKLANEIGCIGKDQIQRALKSLVKRGVLKRRNDLNTHDYDRTYWYCIPGYLADEVPVTKLVPGANGKASQNRNGKAEGALPNTMYLEGKADTEGVSHQRDGLSQGRDRGVADMRQGVSHQRDDDTHVVQHPFNTTDGKRNKNKKKVSECSKPSNSLVSHEQKAEAVNAEQGLNGSASGSQVSESNSPSALEVPGMSKESVTGAAAFGGGPPLEDPTVVNGISLGFVFEDVTEPIWHEFLRRFAVKFSEEALGNVDYVREQWRNWLFVMGCSGFLEENALVHFRAIWTKTEAQIKRAQEEVACITR